MKFNLVLFLVSFALVCPTLKAQKTLTEGTLVYNMSVETGSGEPKIADMFDGATTTIYLKGNKSRTELVSSLGKEATIHDAAAGTGVILKDYSGQKLMITMTAGDWQQNNNKYQGISFENAGGAEKIAGFNCKKAIAKLQNGNTFTVYYTTDVNVANKDYDSQFKTLPGLPVQYEMHTGKMTLKFTLASISYNPVSASKFDIPKSGYRVMTYAETKQKS